MELTRLMKDAGIVGAGGAGFPSYAKISEGADTLLVNGSECEPLLYTDYAILKYELDTVLLGIRTVLDCTDIKKAVLSIKSHTAKRLSLSDGEMIDDKVSVKVLPDVYPIGDEIALIYQSLGRLVAPGKLPITVGVIVYNVETMYNLGKCVTGCGGVCEKWITVGGRINNPVVVRVPVGTPVSSLFKKLGITVSDDEAVIDGGPSMGKVINYDREAVTKTTSGLLVLPKNIQAVESKLINGKMAIARAETACCQCTRCTDMCPRALLGYPLEPHRMVRTAMGVAEVSPVMVLSATLCCGCGICESLACSQGISPKAVINSYKELLAKNKLRYSADEAHPLPEREYRMIPSEKWAYTIGVKKFDKVAEYIGSLDDFDRVRIPIGRHIGVPSIPILNNGDTVSAGDLIAKAAEGLSVAQHASISGKISITNNEIIIDKVK